jgi:type VI secretion system protein VasG
VDNILTNTLLPEISRQLLGGLAEGEKIERITVSIYSDGSFIYATEPGEAMSAATSVA